MAALDQFIASFGQYGGAAQLNRFEVVIQSPFLGNDDRHVSFRVEDVTMPGKNIRTTSNDNIYGPSHEMAQGLTYAEEVNMTIYLSAQHFEKHYVHLWMDYIVKPNTYDLEYYKSYIQPIHIYQLGKNGDRLAGVRLNESFPKTLGPISYSQSNGELARQEVSFAFKDVEFMDGKGNIVTLYDPAAGKYPRQMQVPVTTVPYDDAIMRMSRNIGIPTPPLATPSPIQAPTRNPHAWADDSSYDPANAGTTATQRGNFPNADVNYTD